MKIVQRHDAVDHASQSLGNGRIGRVRIMYFVSDVIGVDLCVEGLLDLSYRSTEENRLPAGRNHVDPEASCPKPVLYFVKIAFRNAELSSKLFRRKPSMVLWRARIVLRGQ